MFALIFSQVIGHGLMLDPVSRNAKHGINTLGGSMWFSQGCTIGCTQCNATGVPVGPGFPNNDTGTYSSPNIGTFGYDIGGPDLCPNDHSKSKVSWSKSCFVFKFCFWESKLQSCSQTSLT
eukprot:gene18144-30397_t